MRVLLCGQHGERNPRETAGVHGPCSSVWHVPGHVYPDLAGETRVPAAVARQELISGVCVVSLCPAWESREKGHKGGKLCCSRGMRPRGCRTLPRERHPHGIRYPALCTCSYARAQHTTATARLGSPHVVQFQLLAASWSSRAKSAIQPRTWAISNVSSEGETPTCVAAVRE